MKVCEKSLGWKREPEVERRKGRAKSRGGHTERFPVIIARGIHLFPYRTQKLSLLALMVLGWQRPGRVGRRRDPERERLERQECFSNTPITGKRERAEPEREDAEAQTPE